MPGRPYFFPDGTVLINMAILDRVELLERFVQKRGRWCASIEYEWRCSHRALDLLSQVDAQVRNMCGQPIQPDHGDYVDIQLLQGQMRAPGDKRTKHLGEAETIVLIRRRAELAGSIFLTDDSGGTDSRCCRACCQSMSWDDGTACLPRGRRMGYPKRGTC